MRAPLWEPTTVGGKPLPLLQPSPVSVLPYWSWPAVIPASSASTPLTPSPLTAPSVRSPLVGAYYSDWFPSNSAQGTLRQHLVPDQGPDRSKVDSTNPVVAEQAIAQATRNGINFFALDYWPSRPAQNENIGAFLRADNLHDIKFCILYETWDLGFDAAHESTPVDPQHGGQFRSRSPLIRPHLFCQPELPPDQWQAGVGALPRPVP